MMRKYRSLVYLCVICLVLNTAPGIVLSEQVATTSDYSSSDLADSAVSMECVNWCLVGVCLFIMCTLYECHLEYSPRIRHNNPDLLINVYSHPGETPWEEWRDAFQESQEDAEDSILESIAGMQAEGGSFTPRDKEEESEESKTIRFKEVDVIGNPLALFAKSYGSSVVLRSEERGEDPEDSKNSGGQYSGGYGDYGSSYSQSGSGSQSSDMGSWAGSDSMMSSQGMSDLAGSEEMSSFSDNENYSEVTKQIEEIQSSASDDQGGGAGGGGAYMCSTFSESFRPYFMSTSDQVHWRFGYPDALSLNAWIPTRKNVGRFPDNLWGGIYPRGGSINQVDEAKAAAVIAQRALDIVTREKQSHVYMQSKGHKSHAKTDRWQMVSPEANEECHAFGESTIFPWKRSPDDKYAWTYWRSYSCCTEQKGAFIGIIEIPPICAETQQQ